MSSFMGGDDGGIMEGAALASLASRPRSRADHSNCYDKNSTDKVIAELNEKLRKQAIKSDRNAVFSKLNRLTLLRIAEEGILPKEQIISMQREIEASLPEDEKRLIQD